MNITEPLIRYLRSDADVRRLTESRIFGPPDSNPASEFRQEVKQWTPHPRKTLVVMAAGGAGAGVGAKSPVDEVDNRFNVRSYGETPYEADQLHNAAYRAMKRLRRYRSDDILLQEATVAGGPLPATEADGDWPYTLGVYLVNATYR